ncbi:hypothetical protein FACS1894191_5520 [Clostridia bacterium]|nr:hypothetical protein FACS1894191_5520 [Clostridia bacterium]
MFSGISASPGIGVGTVLVAPQLDVPVLMEYGRNPAAEKQRFVEAVETFNKEMGNACDLIRAKASEEEARILRTQIEIARDPELVSELFAVLEEQTINLEYAFHVVCNKYIQLFSLIEDDFLRARTADLIDYKNHMLSTITGAGIIDFSAVPNGTVIVARDIAPSSAATIDPGRVTAIATEAGTVHSHISIIARAIGMPSVVSVAGLLAKVKNGDVLMVDGDSGEVTKDPDSGSLGRCIPGIYSAAH